VRNATTHINGLRQAVRLCSSAGERRQSGITSSLEK
jgi:hypothetical protein